MIADAAGNIRSGYFVPGHDVFQVFTLTATGQTSNRTAQTTFDNRLDFASTTSTTTSTSPTVQTDRGDYPPGDTAIITGSGWGLGETVALEIVEAPLVHPAEVLHAVADQAGNIYAGYFVDDHDLGRTFTLTATGQTSGLTAQTTFTDAPSGCATNAQCNDSNPCTVDMCVSGACVNTPGNAGASCRNATGPCDVAEVCDGNNAACPADGVKAAGSAVCRAAAGVCDVAESCDGVAKSCPADVKSTAECRASAGVCDVAESCDGVSNDCPADAFQSSATVCRAAAGVCDVAENCTGSSAACPADAKVPNGTSCNDNSVCTTNDTCQAGVCVGTNVLPFITGVTGPSGPLALGTTATLTASFTDTCDTHTCTFSWDDGSDTTYCERNRDGWYWVLHGFAHIPCSWYL